MISVTLALIVYVLIAGLLLALPYLVFPTRPFGVRIPPAYAHDPAVIAERNRYVRQLGTLAGGLLLADLIYLWSKPGSLLLPQISILLLVMAGWGNYYLSHRRLAQVKIEQQWLAGGRQAVQANATHRSKLRSRPLWVLLGSACAVILLTAAIGAWRYPALPVHLHFVFPAGLGDWTLPATPFNTFLPVIFQVSCTLLLAALAWLYSFGGKSIDIEDPDGSQRDQQTNLQIVQVLLLLLALSFNCAFLVTGLEGWGLLQASGSPMDLVLLAPLAIWLIVAPFLLIGLQPNPDPPGKSGSYTNRDDEAFWKLGLIYVNRSDPALLVPKRSGIGRTLNLGNPLSWLILLALIVFILARILSRG